MPPLVKAPAKLRLFSVMASVCLEILYKKTQKTPLRCTFAIRLGVFVSFCTVELDSLRYKPGRNSSTFGLFCQKNVLRGGCIEKFSYICTAK